MWPILVIGRLHKAIFQFQIKRQYFCLLIRLFVNVFFEGIKAFEINILDSKTCEEKYAQMRTMTS